ncbi:MAG: DUF4276 family protein [Candidatus Muiribacteriota bacterium]|jgi:hypothetical protein
MKNIVFFLEEKSAKVFLEIIVNRLKTKYDNYDTNFYFITFEGKSDLLKKYIKKIKHWNLPNSNFLIFIDEDNNKCIDLKNKIKNELQSNNLGNTIIRIACKELESFYLGDLKAVESVYNVNNLARHQNKKLYRQPDFYPDPKGRLIKLTDNNYQEVDGSRKIADYINLDLNINKSSSYNCLLKSIIKYI